MKKLKFVVIGAAESENTKDLKEAAESKGHECVLMHQSQLVFVTNEGEKMKVIHDGEDLEDFDVFIFRTYSKYLPDSLILADKLLKDGKVVIDNALGKTFVLSKMFEASRMSRNNILYPNTFKFVDFAKTKKLLSGASFPVIAKPVDGRQGRGVTKLENMEDACEFLEKQEGDWMVQEYIPIKFDVRVFVVGNKALGAMKRHLVEGDFRSNIALGAKSEQVELTSELKKLAVNATKAMDYDVAGVDIIEKDGELMVLEVNSGPQWQGFKKATGINPADEIVRYAVSRHQETKSWVRKFLK